MAYMQVVELRVSESGDEYYIAKNPELAGCISHGSTVEEAQENLVAVREDYLEHLKEFNLPTPTPLNIFAQPAQAVGEYVLGEVATKKELVLV